MPSITKFLAVLAIILSFCIPAAVQAGGTRFFQKEIGQWTIEGYRGEVEYCNAKTYWPNGSYAALVVAKGDPNMSLYLHNKDWNIGDPSGTLPEYVATIHFFSNNNGRDSGTIKYELIDSQTVILVNVNDKFIDNWVNYASMEIVMPGTIGRMSIGLGGTRDLVPAFVECIDQLNGNKQGTNL